MLVKRCRPPTCRPWLAAAGSAGGLHAGGTLFFEADTFAEFTLLAGVEAGHRAVVAHHAGPDLAALALVVGQRHGGGGGGQGGLGHGGFSCEGGGQAVASARRLFARRSSSQRGQNSCWPGRSEERRVGKECR